MTCPALCRLMPELPEVEITRRGIAPLVQDKVVARVLVHNPALRWPVPDELARILPGQAIRAVDRRAKYLLFTCTKGTLIVHLGMTGHLRVTRADAPKRKHDHVEVIFADGTALRFHDSRRFGALFWTTGDPLQHDRLARLGPEPFGDAFTAAYLYRLSRQRRVAIKPFLMDARVVVGVGNIYASEALFRAGIRPGRQAGRLGRASFARLVQSVQEVLEASIRAGGTTIRDFSDSTGKPGYFKQELKVYGRTGQGCDCCGAPIRRTRLGQRSTYYCPGCQH
ncbi:MAG: bifunctional DNA-formamidopyrimidine glycosylase/DNA-(apurinic or apyrimidinic site) lyase [Desulfuromonadales bacterium]